jgi:heme a synthase
VPRPTLSSQAYRRITLLSVVALGLIIVSGAAVRLTGSGLGCPDWPKCNKSEFRAELSYHPLIEFGNRVFTGVVSVAVILAVLGSFMLASRRRDLTWWSLGLVFGVLAQIILGAVTVKTHLTPPVVAAHFLVSMVLVWNALVLHQRAGEPPGPVQTIVAHSVRRSSSALVAAACGVLITGTVVTGTGPHGGDEKVRRYDLSLQAVTRLHSATAWVLMALTLTTLWLGSQSGWPKAVRRHAERLVWVIAGQGAIGYIQYAAGVPAWMVIIHLTGATLVFVEAILLWLAGRAPMDLNSAMVAADGSGASPEPADSSL